MADSATLRWRRLSETVNVCEQITFNAEAAEAAEKK
jgi:hypothetical protein